MTKLATTDDELLRLLAEVIPARKRKQLVPGSSLRSLGLDSLGLMLVVSHFLEQHPVPVAEFERGLAKVVTVGDLLDLARSALGSAR